MKATALKKGTPAPFKPRFAQAPDGRTRKAYEPQPKLLPWKCSICIGIVRSRLLEQAKGRDRLSAKEVNAISFVAKKDLERHFRNAHEGQAVVRPTQTRNVIKREARVKAALGL